uniref:NHL repeat containing cell surface protein-like protein n=1 Tax=Adineta vaga TaxID=104782 RepID=B3G4S5_ADIVA|nr:NHL repeat containing cell surface protein-like protein [Adineta vaga]
MYVTDSDYNYVLKRYPNGEIQIAAGRLDRTGGSTPDRLSGPMDVFADENENIYIADWSNQRIQFWGKGAKRGSTIAGNGTRGSALNEFGFPRDVLLISQEHIIVADYENQRITRWPSTYDSKTSIGSIIAGGNGAGLSPPQLDGPTGLYLDKAANNLYIVNELAHTVIQWNLDGYGSKSIYAGIPGRPGNSTVQLQSPQGITMDKYANLYVTDCDNQRIQKFERVQ